MAIHADDEPRTAGVAKFARLTDLSRPTIYRMLNRGDLRSIQIGRKRLILLSSYDELVERQLSAGHP